MKEHTFQDLVDFVDGNRGAIPSETPVRSWSYPDLVQIRFEATSQGNAVVVV